MNPSAKAHLLLAELLESGHVVTAEDVGVARSEEHGIQVIVTFAPYQPLRLDPASAANLKARIAALADPTIKDCLIVRHLRAIEQDALDAAPAPGERPISVKALAPLAGYSCNSHFREAVRRLEVLGLLRRVPGGVIRCQ